MPQPKKKRKRLTSTNACFAPLLLSLYKFFWNKNFKKNLTKLKKTIGTRIKTLPRWSAEGRKKEVDFENLWFMRLRHRPLDKIIFQIIMFKS
jgi:hypothetical protein